MFCLGIVEMTGPLAEAWATPASRRKILLGELPQRLDLGLAHSGVQAPGAEPPGKYWSTFDDVVALSRYLQMKLIYIYLLFLITFFNELWYFTMSPGMPSKISYQWALQRFSYYSITYKKKSPEFGWFQSCLNLPVKKNGIFCTFKCTGDHQLRICPLWSFVP